MRFGYAAMLGALVAIGGFPAKATLQASVTEDGNNISGYQYPPAQCDAQFMMCGDPFQ
jgi:hypothetical protein